MSIYERTLEQLERRDHYTGQRMPYVTKFEAHMAQGQVTGAERALKRLEGESAAEFAAAREEYYNSAA